jgi:hypothetical protein
VIRRSDQLSRKSLDQFFFFLLGSAHVHTLGSWPVLHPLIDLSSHRPILQLQGSTGDPGPPGIHARSTVSESTL